MPFQSEAQRRYLWAKHPDIARRWADEYPGQKNLPTHKDGVGSSSEGGSNSDGTKKEEAQKAAEAGECLGVLAKFSRESAPTRQQKFAPPTYANGGKRSDGLEALKSTDKYTRSGQPVELSSAFHVKTSSGEEGDDEQHEEGPPNYRSAGFSGPRCGSCAHFDKGAATPGAGTCQRYGAGVEANGVCDVYQELEVGTDRIVSPVKARGVEAPPMGGEVPAMSSSEVVPEAEPAGRPMTLSQAFKFGFLYRCAEEGLAPDQICARVEACLSGMKKQSDLGGAVSTGARAATQGVAVPVAKHVVDLSFLAALGLPIAAGVTGGALLSKLNKGDADPETLKTNELAEEYERLADEANRKRLLREESAKGELIRIS